MAAMHTTLYAIIHEIKPESTKKITSFLESNLNIFRSTVEQMNLDKETINEDFKQFFILFTETMLSTFMEIQVEVDKVKNEKS